MYLIKHVFVNTRANSFCSIFYLHFENKKSRVAHPCFCELHLTFVIVNIFIHILLLRYFDFFPPPRHQPLYRR